ncbi:MAG: hypothetical protein R2688_01615 [Fimbriimonadaceae bacterium]
MLVLGSTANAQLTFNFQADTGQTIPTVVAQAFQDASDRLSAIFNDNVTININMGWQNLGAGVLGAAGGSGVAGSYSTFRNSMINDVTSVDDATATANLPTTSLRSIQTETRTTQTPQPPIWTTVRRTTLTLV